MRIPISKVYRAFPELDPYSDEVCRGYLRQARRATLMRRLLFGCLGLILGAVLGIGTIAVIGFILSNVWTPNNAIFPAVTVIVSLFSIIMFPWLGGALAADAVLARDLRRRLRTTGCPSCRYSLVGQVPFKDVRASRWFVRCPECGSLTPVGRGGIHRVDLIHGQVVPENEAPGPELGGSNELDRRDLDQLPLDARRLVARHPPIRRLDTTGLLRVTEELRADQPRRDRAARSAGVIAAAGVALGFVAITAWSPWVMRSPGVAVWLDPASAHTAAWGAGVLLGWVGGAWTKRFVRAWMLRRKILELTA